MKLTIAYTIDIEHYVNTTITETLSDGTKTSEQQILSANVNPIQAMLAIAARSEDLADLIGVFGTNNFVAVAGNIEGYKPEGGE